HLPAPVFTRAFVKSYAREVGLDPAEMASRYLAQFDPPEEVQPTTEAQPAYSVWGQQPWAAFNRLMPQTRLTAIPIALICVTIVATILEHRHGSPAIETAVQSATVMTAG